MLQVIRTRSLISNGNSGLDIRVTPLRRLGAVRTGAGTVTAASSGDCDDGIVRINPNSECFTDKAMSYSEELTSAL